MADDLVDIPENPVPAGAEVHWLTAADGVRLRAARFPATVPAPRGTICLFQGRSEAIEKYFEAVDDLRGRGFTVASLDWRGQGLSQRRYRNRRRGHVRRFAEYQRDLDVFMQMLVLPECPAPYFALAHSMGGNILLQAAKRRPIWFERLVLSAPMIGLPRRQCGWPVRMFARTAVMLGFGFAFVPGGDRRYLARWTVADNPLTGDERRFARLIALDKAAPQLFVGPPTNGWLHAALGSLRLLQNPAVAAAIRTPTLMFAAARDRIVDGGAITRLASRLPTAHVVTLDGARHEILMERDAIRDAFFAAFDAFVPGTEAFPGEAITPL